MPTITIDLDDIVCFAKEDPGLTFSEIRNAPANALYRPSSSGSVITTLALAATSASNKFGVFYRTIATFDTSVIPAGSTIVSATLEFPVIDAVAGLGVFDCCLTGCSPANPASLVLSDGSTFIDTDLAPRIGIIDAYNARVVRFVLNAAGKSYINASGHTSFMFRVSWDVDNAFTGTWAANTISAMQNAAWYNPPNDVYTPSLTVVYEEGSGGGEVILVEGTTSASSSLSATATKRVSVTGSIPATTGATGDLYDPLSLQVAVPVSGGFEGSVTRIRLISVSVPVVSGGTGRFFTQVDIVGTVSGTGSVAGTLQAEVALEVPLAAVTGATGTVIRLRGVAGRVETVGAATGHLEAINQITGTIHAVSSGIGNLHAPVPLTGKIHEVSGAAGIVYSGRVAVLVPGISAGTGVTVTSPITRLRSCSGVTRGYSSVNGDLAPVVPLFADLVASSGTLADLTVEQEVLFSGGTSATSLLSASLNAVISLNGALNTEGKVTGLITYVASLTGLVLETSGAIGDLAGPKPLYGAINSGSSINGEISAARSVNGTISCESSVGGNLTAIVPLNIECTVTGGLNGVLAVPQVERLTGAFPVTGSCAGSIVVTVRLETAIASISEIFGDLKSGVAFSSEVTPVSSVTGELSLGKDVELGGSISAVSINSGIANTRRSLTCEGAAASTTVSVWLSRAIPITGVVLEASWGQANINHSAPLSGTIAAYSGIQGSLGVRSIRAATSYMEACVASTIREAICVRETVGYAVPITAKVSYTFSFTVTSSTRKIVAKTVYRVVSTQYKEEYRVFALPDDLNVGEEVLDCYVVVTKSEFCVVGL